MPVIRLEVTAGLTRDQKKQIVTEFTRTLQQVAGKKPEHIHITIIELEEENWGFAGMLTDEYRKSLADE